MESSTLQQFPEGPIPGYSKSGPEPPIAVRFEFPKNRVSAIVARMHCIPREGEMIEIEGMKCRVLSVTYRFFDDMEYDKEFNATRTHPNDPFRMRRLPGERWQQQVIVEVIKEK